MPTPGITLAVIEREDRDLALIDPIVHSVREAPDDHPSDAWGYLPVSLR